MAQRTVYQIDEIVLDQFNRLVPVRQRSRVIQELMEHHIAGNDDALTRAAEMIEADASYTAVMQDGAALAFSGLARFDDGEG